MSESWKPVLDYEGIYEVSNLGRVRRVGSGRGAIAGRLLRPRPTRKGYVHVALHDGRGRRERFIHSLVAEAFIGRCPPGFECNHKDGNKTNNTAANLEWVSGRGNMAHAHGSGLMPSFSGRMNGRAKLSETDVREIRKLLGAMPKEQIARRFGVSGFVIYGIAKGLLWKSVA